MDGDIMKWLKKIWWILITVFVLLILPLFINYCYSWNTNCFILHPPSGWTTFWATYLAAIASFVMVFITWQTLRQNKEQLEEMKRQWKEQNTPKISCTLEKDSEWVLVELCNTSPVPAHKVHVRITNNTNKDIFRFDKTCEWLENVTFEIPPFSTKQVPILIAPYVDGDYEGYLSVEVNYLGKQDRFDLYLKEINLTTFKYTAQDICMKIGQLDTTIKNKKFM